MPRRPRTRKTMPIRTMIAAIGAKNELAENAAKPMMMKKKPPTTCHNGVVPISAFWVPDGAVIAKVGIAAIGKPQEWQNSALGARRQPQ